ncbi:MAG: metal ABC transporter permease [Leptospirales bacterium]|nr:metal ABC transporter permease [Leptospirales bacterium]
MIEYLSLFGASMSLLLALAPPLAMAGVFLSASGDNNAGLAGSASGALGVALALSFGADQGQSPWIFALSGAAGASIGLVLVGTLSRGVEGGASLVYVLAAATAVLAAASSPLALAEVRSAFNGGLFGASWTEAAIALLVSVICLSLLIRLRFLFSMWILDAQQLRALGRNPELLRILFLLGSGLLLGFAARYAGPLASFALLTLPAFGLRKLASALRTTLLLSAALAVVACSLGLLVSHMIDWPPAESIAATLALLSLALRLFSKATA